MRTESRRAREESSRYRRARRRARGVPPAALAFAALLVIGASAGAFFALRARSASRASSSRPTRVPTLPAVEEPEFSRLRQEAERSTAPDAWLAFGNASARQGRWFTAIWAFQEALNRRPGDLAAGHSIASALAMARHPRVAAVELGTLLEDHSESDPVRLTLARTYRATGRPELALAVLRGHPGTSPLPPEMLLEVGRNSQALGRFDEARQAFEDCARRQPSSPAAPYRLGRLLLAEGRPAEAVGMLRRARVLAPSDAEVVLALGEALRRAKAPLDEVGATLTEAVRLRPGNAEALLALGELYAVAERWPPAAEHLAAAIRADPTAAEPHARLASVLTKMGRASDAAYHRGLYLMTRDEVTRAVKAFRAMAAREPDNPEPVLMASLALVKMRRNLEAAKEVARARSRFPHEAALRERLAMLSVLTSDPSLARRLCEEWRADDPRDPRPLWIEGRIAANEGRWAEAAGLHREALRLGPDAIDAAMDLGRALTERARPADLEEARVVLEQAVVRAPDRSDLHLQLGQTLLALQLYSPARDALLRALDRDGSQVPALNALLQLAPRLGRAELAPFYARLLRAIQERSREEDRLWDRLWENPGEPERFVRMGAFFLGQGDLTRARYALENALAARPDWQGARSYLQRVRRLEEVR